MPRFALSAALLGLAWAGAAAQSKPTSTKRIPITKEAQGQVETVRVDTVTVYRVDTLVKLLGRTEAMDANTSSGVFSDEGSVSIGASDSGFYFVRRDNEDVFGPTTISIGQRYQTLRQYSVVASNGQAVCSDTVRIAAKYERVCLICDVGSRTFHRNACHN